jgi:nucleoside-diphosphate-sugar epimerase
MSTPIERAIVLGASGAEGRAILRALRDRGYDAAGTRRWDEPDREGGGSIVVDSLDVDDLVGAIAGRNFVFMAERPEPTSSPRRVKSAAVRAMRAVCRACREADAERLIVTGALTAVAPRDDGPSTGRDLYLPGSEDLPVTEAMYAAEREAVRFLADGLDVVLLEPALCVGEAPITVRERWVAGRERRVWIAEAEELGAAHVAAAERAARGARYALGSRRTTIGALLEELRASGRLRLERGRGDGRLSLIGEQLRAARHIDPGRARRELGLAREESLQSG